MPFTPFHFGPGSLMAYPFRRKLDLPVYLLANLVVDLEALIVFLFHPPYPMHGLLHTFLIGGIAGALWGYWAWRKVDIFTRIMLIAKIPYKSSRRGMVISGLLGAWSHVLVDALMYDDIRPFWPLQANPLLGLVTGREVYLFCIITVFATALWYWRYYLRFRHKRRKLF